MENDVPWLHVDLSSSNRKGGLGAVSSDVNGFGVNFGLKMIHQIMKLRYRFINSSDTGYIYLVSLLTGRKHQIRLQFSLSKNPIVNDIKFNRKESNGLLGLRAYSIKFWYDKKFYNFKLPLKETLKSFDF